MGRATIVRIAGAATGAALAVGALTMPAAANGAVVTRGVFVALSAAAGQPEQDLAGRAQLERINGAGSHVSVRVSGLRPGATYGIHLHNAPCAAANPGGGHYKHDAAGVAQPPNELWPSSDAQNAVAGVTANTAGVASGRGTAEWLAGSSAVSVVLHAGIGHGATTTAGGPKLACADLR